TTSEPREKIGTARFPVGGGPFDNASAKLRWKIRVVVFMRNARCLWHQVTVTAYEVLHLHHRVQLWNRSARPPDVRLPDGSPGQKTGPHQRQKQRLQLLPQTHRASFVKCSRSRISEFTRAIFVASSSALLLLF